MLNKRNYIGFERNKSYYDESLKRVGKYIGKENTLSYEIGAEDIKDYEKMTTSDELWEKLQVNPTVDKDDDKKLQLWKELTRELEDYFNTQSYGILKNLKVNLSFASKSNDERVKKMLSGDTISNEVVEIPKKVIKDNFTENTLFPDECFEKSSFPEFEHLDVEKFDKAIGEIQSQNKSNETIFYDEKLENTIHRVVLNTLKELAKDNVYVENISLREAFNLEATEEKHLEKIEDSENFCSSIVLSEKKGGRGKDKKPRKRRTKAEIEAARNNEAKEYVKSE